MTGPWGLEIWHENFVVTEFGFYVFLLTESTAVYFLLLTAYFFLAFLFVYNQMKRLRKIRALNCCIVEPRSNEPLFNEVLDVTNDLLCHSNSKIYEKGPRYNKTSL